MEGKLANLQTSLAESRKERRSLNEQYENEKWDWQKREKELVNNLKKAEQVRFFQFSKQLPTDRQEKL